MIVVVIQAGSSQVRDEGIQDLCCRSCVGRVTGSVRWQMLERACLVEGIMTSIFLLSLLDLLFDDIAHGCYGIAEENLISFPCHVRHIALHGSGSFSCF
jgi:hypothetical protein